MSRSTSVTCALQQGMTLRRMLSEIQDGIEPKIHVSQRSVIVLGILENMAVTFGISIVTFLQAEIRVIPV